MGQPLYFLPNLRAAAAESIATRRSVLKERGLSDVFADVPLVEQPLAELRSRGPGDKPGCILYAQAVDGSIPRQSGYYPSEQTWTPVGDGSLLWIGVDNAEPPKPEEMQRHTLCRGYPVGGWSIPILPRHDPAKPTLLAAAFTTDASGNQIQTVRAAYREHFEAFREAAEWVYAGMPDDGPPQSTLVDLAIRALSINYRLEWELQNVLQVVDSENFGTMICAAVDLPGFQEASEAQKKTAVQSAMLSSTPGQPDESTTTPPVGATSI